MRIKQRSKIAGAAAIGLLSICLAWLGHRGYAADAQSPEAQGPNAAGAPAQATPDSDAADTRQAIAAADKQWAGTVKLFLSQNCFKCHGNGHHKGGVALDKFTTLASIQMDHRTWGTVADMLTTKTMPPDDEPQPTAEQVSAVVGWIGQAMELCDCSGPRDPGRIAIHRLNRHEYNNTIRDLVGVDFKPADDFPTDDTGYGFDNIADVLSMSPLLAEKYLSAAEQVMDKAVASDGANKPTVKKYQCATLDSTGNNTGGDLMANGEVYGTHNFPVAGDYEFRLKASQDRFGKENAQMVLKLDGTELKTFDVPNPRRAPRVYKFRAVGIKAGKHKFAAAYTNNKVDRDNLDPKKRGDRNLYVDTIEIEGPFNAAPAPASQTQKRIFFAAPGPKLSEPAAARLILTRFATRAFRRPASVDEVEALMRVYRAALADGEPYVGSVKLSLEAVLISPQFLYRIEADPSLSGLSTEQVRNAPAHPITDYELATRLSYFLWSSMPDEELMRLAGEQQLHNTKVLEQQVKRMLADPKSDAFVTNFVGEWLETRALDDFKPNAKVFPDFDDDLRQAMKKEVSLFFQSILKDDGSVLELLDAKYTFLNERLAKLYGIDGIKGDEFRRVQLSECGEAGKRRGGIMEMAGVLAVTAMPTRTSPVRRGKYVLEQILGTPPPPPPPNVPSLDKPGQVEAGTVRQRFERHRADPVCASCHMRMDPIGFAMENYNALGAWRERDNGLPIDTAGNLPDGTALAGPGDVKKALLDRKKLFVKCMAEKMLTYALGRGVEYYDTCTVRDIAGNVKQHDYRISAMIDAIVQSDAFLKRRPFAEPKVTREKPRAVAEKT
ncbi:MAG TPA: DUF1592 domain-containing protein [Tepidisphaeraceae bacterium]|nr:DUF1592 domain-containing protein [Tepidisphaeraceae bacterium]